MRLLGSLLVALVLVAAPLPARAQTVQVVPQGGTAGDFKKQDLSKGGDKGPFGVTRLNGVDVSIAGEGPTAVVTVTLRLEFTINSARLGEQYTVKENGPCKGLTFAMTEAFIRDHELEHVEQLQGVVRDRVQQVLDTVKTGTAVDARGRKIPTWSYNASAPNPGQVGRAGDPAWQADFKANIQNWVNQFVAQEAAEYAHVEKHGQFPSGGTFRGIEKGARERSCHEFLAAVGSQITQAQDVLTQARLDAAAARKSLGEATQQAKVASDAAAAALAAASANPCNMEAFRRAVERYTAAAGKAGDAVEATERALESAQTRGTEIDTLSTQYDEAKAGARVTAFPEKDRQQGKIRQDRTALDTATAKTRADLGQVVATLAAASGTLKDAYEQIKTCDKSQDPKWKPLLDSLAAAYDTAAAPAPPVAGPPAAGPGPVAPPQAPPAPAPPAPGAPTQDTLRSAIGSLESDRPFTGPAHVPPPQMESSPVPQVPQIPQPPRRRLNLPPAGEPLTEQQIEEVRRAEREERERQERILRQQRIQGQQERARDLTAEAPQAAVPYVPGSLGEGTFASDQAVARLGSLIQQRAGSAPAPAAWSFVPAQIVVGLRLGPPATLAPIVADLETRIGLRRLDSVALTSINAQLVLFEVIGRQTVPGAAAVAAADPRVLFAQPNFLSVTTADHRDALAGLQYGPAMMRVPQAHDRVTGKGIRVAVIDTGVDAQHPDLAGRIGRRANFAEGDDAGEIHGTAMAGIIAATANTVGIYGIAPEAELLAVRACRPRAPEQIEGVCAAYALGRAVDFAIVSGARVINLSVAGPRDALMPRLMVRAHERGIVVVAAVGNLGPKAPAPYPAAIETVIAVTAVDARAAIYPAAVQGPFVSVAAPGVEVVTTFPGGRWAVHTGTSMAAAHVSGVVALLLQARPELSPAAVRGLLESTAQASGPGGRSLQLGHGLVNGCRAVDRTLNARLAC